jgi:hypothetical protein
MLIKAHQLLLLPAIFFPTTSPPPSSSSCRPPPHHLLHQPRRGSPPPHARPRPTADPTLPNPVCLTATVADHRPTAGPTTAGWRSYRAASPPSPVEQPPPPILRVPHLPPSMSAGHGRPLNPNLEPWNPNSKAAASTAALGRRRPAAYSPAHLPPLRREDFPPGRGSGEQDVEEGAGGGLVGCWMSFWWVIIYMEAFFLNIYRICPSYGISLARPNNRFWDLKLVREMSWAAADCEHGGPSLNSISEVAMLAFYLYLF